MPYRADCEECERLSREVEEGVFECGVCRETLELLPKNNRHYPQIQKNLIAAEARLGDARNRQFSHFKTHDG
jgi:hypothetical protein